MFEPLTFHQVRVVNRARSHRWHGDKQWSIADWAVAFAGEAGEVCNAVKKLRRVEDALANISADPKRAITSRQQAIKAIGEELADTFMYMDLLAQSMGIDLEEEIKRKFNAVSERYEFPERL